MPEHDDLEHLPVAPPRRTILRGALALGVTGVAGTTLAGCGNGEASTTASGPAAAGTMLGATSDIPVGGGTIFTDAKVVVTQPKKGIFKAFSSICTHAGCPVTKVADGLIQCPCHGSRYSIADGSVQRPPAQNPLPAVAITTAGGTIKVA
jgi:nitrite reductase/ring-hydroxylating ferredoxin subunit